MQKFKNKMLIQKGFTLVELLVCLFLSVLIIALLCQTILANNRLYKGDIVRTNLNQDLKSAMPSLLICFSMFLFILVPYANCVLP